MTETTRTYTTLDDLYTHEIAGALNGVEENFDTDGFLHALRERDLIIWTGTGFALVIDDEGNTPGFWELVKDFDAQAQAAPVELYETDAVCLITRGGRAYIISDVDMVAGQAVGDAQAWIAGDWDPSDDLEEASDNLTEIKHVATIGLDMVTMHNEPGANADSYLTGKSQ